ncbi:TPA: replication protein [Staphylococcus aureus]|nr:replication protein [Staphylococcus aureus]MCS4713935.1 replication protein [Staphylococcus aureus]MCS4763340.1 replication protein [Staphylococcus aureus]MCS4792043.1 replication protein [Staphylococcus aureus]MCS4870677.1 replication protein [Staphylococcus aureus]
MQYNTTRSITENQDNKTLKDMTKSQRPWREKKIDNVRFCCKVKK